MNSAAAMAQAAAVHARRLLAGRSYTGPLPGIDAILTAVLTPSDAPTGRRALRQRLLAARAAADPASIAALHARLATHLLDALSRLAPQLLGAYAPIGSEFNALPALLADPRLATTPFALPYCRRNPREMTFRRWPRGAASTLQDECGIASTDGAVCVPDVLVVPCVGYTDDGLRLGYGGGYFDRYLAAHPHVTTVGIALSNARIDVRELAPQPHDRALTLVVTERGPL